MGGGTHGYMVLALAHGHQEKQTWMLNDVWGGQEHEAKR